MVVILFIVLKFEKSDARTLLVITASYRTANIAIHYSGTNMAYIRFVSIFGSVAKFFNAPRTCCSYVKNEILHMNKYIKPTRCLEYDYKNDEIFQQDECNP